MLPVACLGKGMFPSLLVVLPAFICICLFSLNFAEDNLGGKMIDEYMKLLIFVFQQNGSPLSAAHEFENGKT